MPVCCFLLSATCPLLLGVLLSAIIPILYLAKSFKSKTVKEDKTNLSSLFVDRTGLTGSKEIKNSGVHTPLLRKNSEVIYSCSSLYLQGQTCLNLIPRSTKSRKKICIDVSCIMETKVLQIIGLYHLPPMSSEKVSLGEE